MISAQQLVEIRREHMRRHLEEDLLKNAENHYLGYTTDAHNCPSWLREELKELGYDISFFGSENKGVQILFGEKYRD